MRLLPSAWFGAALERLDLAALKTMFPRRTVCDCGNLEQESSRKPRKTLARRFMRSSLQINAPVWVWLWGVLVRNNTPPQIQCKRNLRSAPLWGAKTSLDERSMRIDWFPITTGPD